MKWNRFFLLIAGIIILTSMTGCKAKTASKPDVTIIIKTPSLSLNTVGELDVETAREFLIEAGNLFSESYDKANVTFKVEVFDYVNENEAVIGAYGTDDAVDILYEGYFNMAAYVSGGNVVSLDDIITDSIRLDINNSTWTQSMKNGKTYMMPFLSMQNIMIYNKSLFKQCGLEEYCTDEVIIQNWTLEEWKIILDTLAGKLPSDSYPMFMYGNNNQGDTHIMSLILSHDGNLFDSSGNFDFESSENLSGLKWIQDGVNRGWYPPHPELLEMLDCQELFNSSRLGIFIFNNANYMLYDNIEDNYGFVNFPGNIATSFITGFEIFDNGDALKVETAKDFLKFIYENETLMSVSAGNLPESKKVVSKYTDQIVMLSQFSENSDNVIDFMNSSPNWQGKDNSVRNVFWVQIHELLAGRITPQQCAANLNRDCNAAIHVETSYHE